MLQLFFTHLEGLKKEAIKSPVLILLEVVLELLLPLVMTEIVDVAIPAGNVKRVVRALEFYELSGKRISEHNEEQKAKGSPYNFAYFVLNDHRNLLYNRIEKRIDEMLKEGLIEEVQALKNRGFTKNMVSMQGLGYKEILDYLDGNLTLEEAIYILKRDTRHFAKRQLTWFRRETSVSWIHKYEYDYNDEKILAAMLDILKEKEIIL